MAETVPRQTVQNSLNRLGNKPIALGNGFPILKRSMLHQDMVLFIQDITCKREDCNIGLQKKEKIQFIVDLGEACSDKQAENCLEYLIRMGRLVKLKRNERVVGTHGTTTDTSQIPVAQKYCSHCLIESEWKKMCLKNLLPAHFGKFFPHLKHNLDVTCLMCSDSVLKVICDGDQKYHINTVKDVR